MELRLNFMALELIYTSHSSTPEPCIRIYAQTNDGRSFTENWVTGTPPGMSRTLTTHRYVLLWNRNTKVGTFKMINPSTGATVYSKEVQNVSGPAQTYIPLGILIYVDVIVTDSTLYWGNIEMLL